MTELADHLTEAEIEATLVILSEAEVDRVINAEADPEAKRYMLRCRKELIRRLTEAAVAHRRKQRIQELEAEVAMLRHLAHDGMH